MVDLVVFYRVIIQLTWLTTELYCSFLQREIQFECFFGKRMYIVVFLMQNPPHRRLIPI